MIQHHLLLVDGNLNERGVRERFFESEGFSVATAATAEEALSILAADPLPVLVISSVHLESIDGFALCECLSHQEATRDIPFILIADRPLSDLPPVDQLLVKQKLKQAGVDPEDYLPRSIDLGALLDRAVLHITLVGRAQLTQALLDGTTRSGRLEYMGVVELAQLFETSGRSGKVLFELNGDRAQLFFRDGQLIDARVGYLSEKRAFFRLLAASEGEFELTFGEPGRPARIETPTRALIDEGTRRLEELRWMATQLPPLDTVLEFNLDLLSERLSEIPDETNELMRHFDGRRTLREVLELAAQDDLEAMGVVGNLVFDGLLVPSASDARDAKGDLSAPQATPFPQAEETPPPPAERESARAAVGEATATPAELLFFEEAAAEREARQGEGEDAEDQAHLQGEFQAFAGVQIGGAAAEHGRSQAEDATAGAEESATTDSNAANANASPAPAQDAPVSLEESDDDFGFFSNPPARAETASAPSPAVEVAAALATDNVPTAAPVPDSTPATIPSPTVSHSGAPAHPQPTPASAELTAVSDQEMIDALRPSRRWPLTVLGAAALLGVGLLAGQFLADSPETPDAPGTMASSAQNAPQASAAAPPSPAPAAVQPPATNDAPPPATSDSTAAAATSQEQATASAPDNATDAKAAPMASASQPEPSDAPVLAKTTETAPASPAPVAAQPPATNDAPPATQPTPAPAKVAAAPQPPPSPEPAPAPDPEAEEEAWEKLLERGEALLDAERLSAAAKVFREAIKKRPNDQRALSGLGRALIDRNPNQAIKLLNRALKIDPTDALAWHDLGVAYQFSSPERPREALHAYEQFLDYAPNSKKPNAEEIRTIVKMLKEELAAQ